MLLDCSVLLRIYLTPLKKIAVEANDYELSRHKTAWR